MLLGARCHGDHRQRIEVLRNSCAVTGVEPRGLQQRVIWRAPAIDQQPQELRGCVGGDQVDERRCLQRCHVDEELLDPRSERVHRELCHGRCTGTCASIVAVGQRRIDHPCDSGCIARELGIERALGPPQVTASTTRTEQIAEPHSPVGWRDRTARHAERIRRPCRQRNRTRGERYEPLPRRRVDRRSSVDELHEPPVAERMEAVPSTRRDPGVASQHLPAVAQRAIGDRHRQRTRAVVRFLQRGVVPSWRLVLQRSSAIVHRANIYPASAITSRAMRIHDGAYGTLLAPHLHGDETVDDLCLRAPGLVIDAHRAYIEAGATAIQTNSFLVHQRGSDRRRRDLRLAALDCAREAAANADTPVDVFVTIGPIGDHARRYWEPIEQALDAGVRSLQLETISTRAIADAGIAAWGEVAAGVPDAQLLLGCTTDPADAARSRWVVDLATVAPDQVIVGLNCCEGPEHIGGLLAAIVEQRGTSWAMPSAGVTQPYIEPAQWASIVLEETSGLDLAGIGGCCGTSPASIQALQRI